MFKKAAIVAVALAGTAYTEALAIQKRDGAHGHHDHAAAAPAASGYSAPASGYSAPASGYGAPAASYSAPAASYSAPADGYGAPADGYGAPESYSAPAYSADVAPAYGADGAVEEGGAGPGLLPIIIGILSLVGLSLLFPTFVSLSTGRRKRSITDGSPMTDMMSRIQDIYGAVLESEECMEKIACELGALSGDIGFSPVAKVAESFIPSRYSNYYSQFKSGKNCDKIQCGTH